MSPGTVATAYKELRRRAIVVTRGRGGTVVAAALSVASQRPPKVPDGLRDLAGGHPDPNCFPVWCRRHSSTPVCGHTAVRHDWRDWRTRYGTGSGRTACRRIT
ncbi:hypothetical protein [Streptomyces dengpaensis]|uniref:hypothetical protein n=1 Tax=Streptomyces dengpaensis TaxID=2049881 RepID=UPI001F0BCDA5|nr:hypothetical protein [Streptomyces dengpaensis]